MKCLKTFLVLYHSGENVCTGLPHLGGLNTNQSIGLLLSSDGSLSVYLDGQYIKRAADDIPLNQPLWGVVDVCGICSMITSEIMSGKLKDVPVINEHNVLFGFHVFCLAW